MRTVMAALLAVGLATPALADDVEAALEAALEAYRAGDIGLAREEVDFASTLLGQMKADGLLAFLPEPMDGWTRETGDGGQSFAAFGGGAVADAVYRGGGQQVEVTLMADNQFVSSMAVMFSNPAMMGATGTLKRKGRQRYVVTHEGEVQALVDGRILVQISGSPGATEAYFDLIDLEALKDF